MFLSFVFSESDRRHDVGTLDAFHSFLDSFIHPQDFHSDRWARALKRFVENGLGNRLSGEGSRHGGIVDNVGDVACDVAF